MGRFLSGFWVWASCLFHSSLERLLVTGVLTKQPFGGKRISCIHVSSLLLVYSLRIYLHNEEMDMIRYDRFVVCVDHCMIVS